jgi:hypothetical protein
VGAEPPPGEAEHPVADLEGRDVTAGRLDLARELTALDPGPWSQQAGEQAREEGPGPRKPLSVRFTVVACTLTSTSLCPGVGLATSVTRTTSGGP